LFWLARQAAMRLGPDYDLEVVEMHHRQKKDSPSGTAQTIADILAHVRNQQLEQMVHPRQRGAATVIHGRSKGQTDIRDSSQVCVHSLRGGDVFGDHNVIFAGDGERVELTHRASSREAFANGALIAASWVKGKDPGVYSMQDVLGLT
jgi:4-hydroxy-tetrahydrodipicolinate reductase